MKLAIPVNNNSDDTKVSESFGRAPYFLIYDTDTKESNFIKNDAVSSQGGAGVRAAQTIVDQKADALIAPRCGENAAEIINAAGIKLYKTKNDSVADNITGFVEKNLSLLEDIHPGFHNHG